MVYFIDGDNTNPCVTITVRIGLMEHVREFWRELIRNPGGDYWEIGADCCRWLESIGVDKNNTEKITWDAEHTVTWLRLESCEWNGRTVFPTLGCTIDGRGPMCGLFSSESDARDQQADSLAVAIVTLDSLTPVQAEIARVNSERLSD